MRYENTAHSVKSFQFETLNVHDRMVFRAGQWLDVHIPKEPIVGGYSLISAPSKAVDDSVFELAIKDSSHPPARWFHEEAYVGSEVQVRVGGDFTYPPADVAFPQHFGEVVFLAGGVGINPFLAMLRYIESLKQRPKLYLLYGSKANEILFLQQLASLNCLCPENVELYVSDGKLPEVRIPEQYQQNVISRRIAQKDVHRILKECQSPIVYICGPTEMTDSFEKLIVEQEGLGQNKVFVEKWW